MRGGGRGEVSFTGKTEKLVIGERVELSSCKCELHSPALLIFPKLGSNSKIILLLINLNSHFSSQTILKSTDSNKPCRITCHSVTVSLNVVKVIQKLSSPAKL